MRESRCYNGYINLVGAIVNRAIQDYQTTQKTKENASPNWRTANAFIFGHKKLETFLENLHVDPDSGWRNKAVELYKAYKEHGLC